MFLQTKGNCTIIALFELGFIAIYLINAFKEIRQFKETFAYSSFFYIFWIF